MMKKLSLLGLLYGAPAFATTVLALDLPALTRLSNTVVQGKVTGVEAKMSSDGKKISTYVAVQVSDVMKGAQATQVEVVQPGGVVGEVGQAVAGTVKLEVGDEVVLFLERKGPNRFLMTGMAQGCFHVERASDGVKAVQDSEGHMLKLDPVTRAPVEMSVGTMKLEELKARVRALAAEPLPPQDPKPVVPVRPKTETVPSK